LVFNIDKIFTKESENYFGPQLFIDYASKGFQKAQELLSDRMFTLEDMKTAFQEGMLLPSGELSNWENHFKERFQSLQNKSWIIELETFESYSTVNGRGEEITF